MSLAGAVLYYGVRLIIFAVVAGIGIAMGIKIRKNKNENSTK